MKRIPTLFLLFLIAFVFAAGASAVDYAVNAVTVSENAVTVNVTAQSDCALWVAAYDASGVMLAADGVSVSGGPAAQTLTLNFADIPSDAYAKAFLFDKETFHSLCVPNDSIVYTEDVYAILYNDGTLVFQHGDTPESGRDVIKTYAVDMTGSYEIDPATPWYGDCGSIQQVEFVDKIRPKSTAYWFYMCERLQEIKNLTYLDTSDVSTMESMFNGCQSLAALDLSAFDTSKVTTMRGMFQACASLTALDLRSFDTSNVTDMSYLFYWCSALTALDLGGFRTSNVTDMSYLFYQCVALTALDLSAFDTSNVTDMSRMFDHCARLTALNLSSFDTSNVIRMGSLFNYCTALTALDLSSFDTSNVTDMDNMFNKCSYLVTIFVSGQFVTDNVVSGGLFFGCVSIVGGADTRYDNHHFGVDYAHIDGGRSNPGFFTAK